MKIFPLTKDAMFAKYAEHKEKLKCINKELQNIPDKSAIFAIELPNGKTYYGTATHARTRITDALTQLIDVCDKEKIDVSLDDIKITYALVDNPISELDKLLRGQKITTHWSLYYIEDNRVDKSIKIDRNMEFGWCDR